MSETTRRVILTNEVTLFLQRESCRLRRELCLLVITEHDRLYNSYMLSNMDVSINETTEITEQSDE